MKPPTAHKILCVVSVLMIITASVEIAFVLFNGEILSWLTYTVIFLTMANGALSFIIGRNHKRQAKKEEGSR